MVAEGGLLLVVVQRVLLLLVVLVLVVLVMVMVLVQRWRVVACGGVLHLLPVRLVEVVAVTLADDVKVAARHGHQVGA